MQNIGGKLGTQKWIDILKEGVNRQRLMQSELRTLNGLASRILGCLKINSMFCSTVLYFLTCHVLTNVVRVIESEII